MSEAPTNGKPQLTMARSELQAALKAQEEQQLQQVQVELQALLDRAGCELVGVPVFVPDQSGRFGVVCNILLKVKAPAAGDRAGR